MMAISTNITRRGMILGAMALPVALDMAFAAPGSKLAVLLHNHRQADAGLDALCAIDAYDEVHPAHGQWAPANEFERHHRRALLAYVPRDLGEVRTVAQYLTGRMGPNNRYDFEDGDMVETFVSALAEIEVAA